MLTKESNMTLPLTKALFNFKFMPLAAFIFLAGISSCQKQAVKLPSPPKVDSDLAYELVKENVAIGPRASGTPGAKKNAEFIADKAKEFGAETYIKEFDAMTPEGRMTFRNVIAEIKGSSNDLILIGGHYDTKRLTSIPDFQGANDGASSTGLMLALIKAVKTSGVKLPLTLKFVFFDGEECFVSYGDSDGFFGSKHFVEELKKQKLLSLCQAVIIIDMIGDRDLSVTLPSGSDPELKELTLEVAKKQKVAKYFQVYSQDILDDHTPFQQEGIPAIDIIDFEFGKNNCYWHTSGDSMDKISAKSLETVGNVILEMIWQLQNKR
jgi:glutaminyl-peptide cyclotransferase